ncbi:hypothetical protein POV27_06415 [Aureisphaera galaxeae]|uniref:hypothetical protein n=1 Tax=Aureisphaera galaxeae TaxID=1538023 RepID=UPI002350A90F|nr:hypothetical protein [Aureisphaera galaxeae]MDC8003676.1 hypothetical protein [Aureisphaera galaxeae]
MRSTAQIKTALFLLLFVIFYGCQYDPYAKDYNTKKPSTVDMVGRYFLEKQTVDHDMTDFKNAETQEVVTPEIRIHSNGTYKVMNLPRFNREGPHEFLGLISHDGNWTFTERGTVDKGGDKLETTWGILLEGLPDEVLVPGIMYNKSPHKLIFGFGDPDNGNAMLFRRE